MASAEAATGREGRRVLSFIALAFAMLCSSCSSVEYAKADGTPASTALGAEPRGIVGELCPPALAAKGYC